MFGRFFFPCASSVLFGGSRSLPGSFASAVSSLVSAALSAGSSVSVGCASGADQAVLSAVLAAGAPGRLSVFAVGSPSGSGFWSGSAPLSLLRRAAAAGDRVVWSAGGGPSVPFRARLFRRSLAALASASLAVFFAPGPGSLAVAGAAVAAGVPVLAVVAGSVPPAGSPRGCCGAWFAAGFCGVSLPAGFSAWAWSGLSSPRGVAGQAVLPGLG